MAAVEQYVRLAVQFALIATVSRLLTPTEIGISVIGTGIVAIALGAREFATSDFLIQRQHLTRDDVRASFTVVVLLTALITAGMFLLAPWFGSFYGEEGLTRFLEVAAIGGLIEATALPIRGMLRRDMAFGRLALINTAAIAVTALMTIILALAGLSFMSFAWGTVAGAITTALLSFAFFRSDLAIFYPTLRSWGRVLSFGGYNGASFVINRVYESLPQLVLGRLLPSAAVGIYNRAHFTVGIPDRVVLMSILPVVFPAFAAEVRRGRSLKEPYLRALSLITVFYWPGQVLLALLAFPVVRFLLGQQWLEVAPLLQIMAVAGLAWFPVMLTPQVLLAIGANRDRVLAELIGRSVAALVLCSAAGFGMLAMAASKLLTLPFQMILSMSFVRRHVPFRWRELGLALWRSAAVTACAAAGPACVIAWSETGFDLPLAATVLAVLSAVGGWTFGIVMTAHPVLGELSTAAQALLETLWVRRLRVRLAALSSPRAGQAPGWPAIARLQPGHRPARRAVRRNS